MINKFTATIIMLIVWISFIAASAFYVTDCISGVFSGCDSSSGFAESFNVINLMAMFVFAPLLLMALMFDITRD